MIALLEGDRAWVSILSRPEGRLQPGVLLAAWRCPGVSILSRPEGRLQLLVSPTATRVSVFQSSAAPKGGCNKD